MEPSALLSPSSVQDARATAIAPPSLPTLNNSDSSSCTYGEKWARAFGICIQRDDVAIDHRARFARLKDKFVFKMDAVGNADPLSAFMEQHASTMPADVARRLPQRIVRGSIIDDSDDDDDDSDSDDDDNDDDDAQGDSPTTNATAAAAAPSSGGLTWAQYFSDETLLYEINTDLERLYPAGHETLFQTDAARAVLRHVLFVWCKLHPDVSYRQGMHDVAAVVLYAFLVCSNERDSRNSDTVTTHDTAIPLQELPATVEADTFSVFEAIMLYIKPFYAIAQSPPKRQHDRLLTSSTAPQLFASYSGNETDDPTGSASGSLTTTDMSQQQQTALARMCSEVQYKLLEQTDPQLFFHLRNLEIEPETYCLRWLRLLFAREFSLDALLRVWDAMICDATRRAIACPATGAADDTLPHLVDDANDDVSDDASADWIGFPLLRFLCVAKLLTLSKELRAADNTGCWRLLMQTTASSTSADVDDTNDAIQQATALVYAARVLRDPRLAASSGSNGVDVVEFVAGPLGIILTAAGSPFTDRLAVKAFVADGDSRGVGQAEASGCVRVGDILHSINGVSINGVTTEEVKRHLQLIKRPVYMGFLHPAAPATVSPSADSVADSAEPSRFDRDIAANAVSESESESADTGQAAMTHRPLFLPGELCYAHVATSVERVVLTHDGACLSHYLSGTLWITNYRCCFVRLLDRRGAIDWQVPVLAIASIDSIDSTGATTSSTATSSTTSTTANSVNALAGALSAAALDHAQAVLGLGSSTDDSAPSTSTPSSYRVVLRCKDTQVLWLSFARVTEYRKLLQCLTALAFPSTLLDAFCFAFAPRLAPSEAVPFDLRREYKRLGLLDVPMHLRCIDQSLRYDLCATYPQHVVVPTNVSDRQLQAAAAFRSGGRLPVVTWLHRSNGATISRSSQPLVGLKSARCIDDERLVHLLCTATNHSNATSYVIMDARGQLAAVGNKAMGKGTEVVSNYRGAKLVFLNVDNIHAVRQSLASLVAVFEPKRTSTPNDDAAGSNFYRQLESSGWLRHVRLVLRASVELAHAVHTGVSVLTHCSDGWDRTAQMVATAELLLDPFYRTLRGFQVLVEKDWCAFGHQFGTRCGHARSDATHDQRAPVFLLWLDCVWQVMRQHPSEIEFNEKLLLMLADHVYACKYGTFMFDCERQRKEIFAKHRVHSIWSDVNSNSELFTNDAFAPSGTDAFVAPSTLSKNIKLWKGYFCRWDSTIVPPVPAFQYY